MKQTSQNKAKEICQHILKAFPNKSLEEFLDMVEYPAFQAKIPGKTILKVAHEVYGETKSNHNRLALKERIPGMDRDELILTHKKLNEQYVLGTWTDYDAECWDMLVERMTN